MTGARAGANPIERNDHIICQCHGPENRLASCWRQLSMAREHVLLWYVLYCLFLGTLSYSLGYLGWEFPTTQLLQRMPLGKYSAVCIILWGFILCCFAAVSNFGGAVAIRFFLGIFEAAVTPGFALLTSQVWSYACYYSFLLTGYSGGLRKSKVNARVFGLVSMELGKLSAD